METLVRGTQATQAKDTQATLPTRTSYGINGGPTSRREKQDVVNLWLASPRL